MMQKVYRKNLYRRKYKIKKQDILLFLVAILVIILSFCCNSLTLASNSEDIEKAEKELTETIDEQLAGIDLSGFQNLLDGLSKEEYYIFYSYYQSYLDLSILL